MDNNAPKKERSLVIHKNIRGREYFAQAAKEAKMRMEDEYKSEIIEQS